MYWDCQSQSKPCKGGSLSNGTEVWAKCVPAVFIGKAAESNYAAESESLKHHRFTVDIVWIIERVREESSGMQPRRNQQYFPSLLHIQRKLVMADRNLFGMWSHVNSIIYNTIRKRACRDWICCILVDHISNRPHEKKNASISEMNRLGEIFNRLLGKRIWATRGIIGYLPSEEFYARDEGFKALHGRE